MKKILKRLDRAIKDVILLFPIESHVYFYLSRSYYFLRFVYFYKRLPGKSKSFADFLFQIKIGKSLRNPLRRKITSKLGGKAFIRSKIGGQYIVKTIKVLSNNKDIDTFRPTKFPIVIKPNHSSGRYFKISSLEEYESLKDQFKQLLLHDYFRDTLEENYFDIPKKIIVEKFIDPEYYLEGSVHCLNGKIKIISLIDRFNKDKKRESYDDNMKPLGFAINCPFKKMNLNPRTLIFIPKLKEAIHNLCSNLNYIRVDFYANNLNFLLGELTNLPGGGNLLIYPKKNKAINQFFFKRI